MQSQLNDATSLAKETRKEAERLRKAAEELELQAAAAVSMQPQQQAVAAKPSAVQVASNTNGHQAPSYGFGTMPPPMDGGYGNQMYGMGSGFNTNVMGHGGTSIPTPSAADDPYGNPFG